MKLTGKMARHTICGFTLFSLIPFIAGSVHLSLVVKSGDHQFSRELMNCHKHHQTRWQHVDLYFISLLLSLLLCTIILCENVKNEIF